MRRWLKQTALMVLASLVAGAVGGVALGYTLDAGLAEALRWAGAGAVAALVLLVVLTTWQG